MAEFFVHPLESFIDLPLEEIIDLYHELLIWPSGAAAETITGMAPVFEVYIRRGTPAQSKATPRHGKIPFRETRPLPGRARHSAVTPGDAEQAKAKEISHR